MNYRRAAAVLVALLAAAAVIVPVTSSRPTVVSATGVIAGSGTSYTLTVTNTSSANEVIQCMRFFAAPGVQITGVSGPGQPTAAGSQFAARASSLIPPGGSAVFSFTTAAAYPTDAGGELHVSADCVGDAVSRATGPAAAPPPPPAPCRCTRLEGRIAPRSLVFTNPGENGGMHLEFTVAWTMICTTGSGACRGQLELFPPQPARRLGTRLKPISGRIACNGPCAATSTGTKHFTLIGGRPLGHDRRGTKVKEIKLRMKRTCQGVRTSDRVFTLVFNKRTGLIDKKKSDLNADGKPG